MTKVSKNINPRNNNFKNINECRAEVEYVIKLLQYEKSLVQRKDRLIKDLYYIKELQGKRITKLENQLYNQDTK